MSFEATRAELRARYRSGSLRWDGQAPLSQALNLAGVPDEPGVYVLELMEGDKAKLVYVGRAGTIEQAGGFKNQRLRGRLQAKQDGMTREAFFRLQLHGPPSRSLLIEWFVTWDASRRTLPALAEAELMQAFVGEFGVLPRWNKSF